MKKTAFVLFLAAIMVFAFAATAMAGTSSGTVTWDPTAGDNPNNDLTPHKGYTLTTEKCLVCHAVHKAPADGQVLLGATVANACNYCHVENNGITTKLVYGGDGTVGTDDEFGHQITCTLCHAVHGANTVEQADLSSKILRADADYNGAADGLQAGLPADWDMTGAVGSTELGALSAYCTQCHPYYTGTYADSDTDGDITNLVGDAANTGTFNSHIMTDDFVSYDPANGATQTGIQVAWASSAYCTNCHDAGRGTGDSADSFPHETYGARFMQSAEYFGDLAATDATSPTEDGVCLKCHRGTATTGVGFGF